MKKFTNALLLGSAIAFSLSTTAFASDAKNYPVNDSTITSTIQKDYSQDKLLNPFNIKVNTNNGVVSLSGLLDTELQYKKAITLAESTPGVEDVNADKLTVKDSQSTLSDTYITAKIDGLLLREATMGDKDIKFSKVDVETTNGVVYLSGEVENQTQINNIIAVVNSVDGVKSVKSDLRIKAGE